MNSKVDVKSYAGFREITWICLFILYAPLIVVTVYSFNASASIAAWGGWSWQWYIDVFIGPESTKFKKAAFGIWLCDDPADKDLKEGMLKG